MADSIKLFSFIRKYCHVVGIYSLESNQNGSPMNSRNWIYIISYALFFLSTAAFFIFEAKSMLMYGLSFLAASAGFFFMCEYVAMICQMKNIWSFIENLERFIEKRDDSIAVYPELIEKIERLCEFLGISMIITALCETLPFLLYTLINYCIMDLGEESFFLFYPGTWPFNWKTPLGYFVAWLVQSAGITSGALAGVMIMNFLFGSCWLFIVMAEDITRDMTAFNKVVEANANRAEWMKRFCDIIQAYSDAKELVIEFNRIVRYSLFSFMFHLMLCETSILLALQFQLMDAYSDNLKLIETAVMFLLAILVFGILFFMNEIGERVTIHFDMVGEDFGRCDWHMLPMELQGMYSIFLLDTQQPIHMKCYGNVIFSRETFKKILQTGWSYFMSIRQIEI